MKKILGTVVIAGVLVVGSYYGAGIMTEKKIRETAKALSHINNANMLVEVKHYNRGLFHSSADLAFNLSTPERLNRDNSGKTTTVPGTDLSYTLPVTVAHGPVAFSSSGVKWVLGYAHAEVPLPPEFEKQFDKLFTKESVKPKLNFDIFVSYLLRSKLTFSVPEFSLKAQKGSGELHWKGLQSMTSTNVDLSNVNGALTLNEMTFSQDGKGVDFSGLKTTYEMSETAYGFYTGSVAMQFPSLVVTDKSKKVFELANLNVSSNSGISDDLVHSGVELNLDAVSVQKETFGPAKFDMEFRNLDAPALGKINELSRQLQGADDIKRSQLMMQVLSELPKLLSKGPEIEISEMYFKLPHGNVKGNLLIRLPQNDKPNLMTLMGEVSGKAHVEVPRTLIAEALTVKTKQQIMQNALQQSISQQQTQAPLSPSEVQQQASTMVSKQLDALIASGTVKQEGDNLVMDVSVEKGKLLVNGNPFNPAMLKNL